MATLSLVNTNKTNKQHYVYVMFVSEERDFGPFFGGRGALSTFADGATVLEIFVTFPKWIKSLGG